MVRFSGLIAMFLGLTLTTLPAYAQMRLQGEIRIVGGEVETPVMLSVNGMEASGIEDDRFDLSLPEADHYALRFSGDDIFTAVQTFSAHEVAKGAIAPIDLVARKEGRVELIFGGDVMAGRRYLKPVWGEHRLIHDDSRLNDMKALLAPMKPYFETADIASINLESILSEEEPSEAAPKSVVFFSHPDLAEALLWMGVDHVSLGNNHVYDYLEPGLDATLTALDAAGLPHSGAGQDAASAMRGHRITLSNTIIDMLGVVGWAGRVEPNQVAEADKGGAAHGTEGMLRAMVEASNKDAARAIIQYHGNREYSDGPTDIGETRLHAAVDAGAPLVIGHHPHVAQGFEIRDGKLIALSLGNFMFDQYFMETHRAIALKVWLDDGEFFRAEAIPLQILDYRPVPANDGQRLAILDRLARLSAERGTLLALSGGHLTMGQETGAPYISQNRDRNLFPRGDFEAMQFGAASDRSMSVEGGAAAVVGDAINGHALKLVPDDRQCSLVWTTKTFLRVVKPGEYRLMLDLADYDGAPPRLSIQQRPQGMGRFDALEQAPWHPLASALLDIDGERRLGARFQLAGEGERALPFRLKLGFADDCDGLLIDNVSIVERSP